MIPKEVEELHTARKQQGQDLNLDILAPELISVTINPITFFT